MAYIAVSNVHIVEFFTHCRKSVCVTDELFQCCYTGKPSMVSTK